MYDFELEFDKYLESSVQSSNDELVDYFLHIGANPTTAINYGLGPVCDPDEDYDMYGDSESNYECEKRFAINNLLIERSILSGYWNDEFNHRNVDHFKNVLIRLELMVES